MRFSLTKEHLSDVANIFLNGIYIHFTKIHNNFPIFRREGKKFKEKFLEKEMGRAYGLITTLGPTLPVKRRAYFSSSSSRRVLDRQTVLDFCISYQYVHEEHASKRQK